MKKAFYKRLAAAVTSISVLAASAACITLSASGEHLVERNFSTVFTNENMSEWTEITGKNISDFATVTADSENPENSVLRVSGNGGIMQPSAIKNCKIKSYSVDVRLSGNDITSQLPIYYDYTDAKNNKYQTLSHNPTHGQIASVFWLSETDRSGQIGWSKLEGFDPAQWFTVTVDYSKKTPVTVTQGDFVNTIPEKRAGTVKNPAAFVTAFLSGGMDCYVEYDNLSVNYMYSLSNDPTLKNYLDTYSDILNKSLSDIKAGDLTVINDALAAYNALNSEMKDALINEFLSLNSKKDKATVLNGTEMTDGNASGYFADSFTNDAVGSSPLKWCNISEYQSPCASVIESNGEKILSMKSNDAQTLRIADGWLSSDEHYATVFSFRFYRNIATSFNDLRIYYDYTDENNYKYLQLKSGSAKTACIGNTTCENGKVTVTPINKFAYSIGLDYGTWIDVKLTYVDGLLSLRMTQNDEKVYEKTDISYSKAAFMLSSSSDGAYYDDVAVNYYDTDTFVDMQNFVNEYRTKYTEALLMNENTYTDVMYDGVKEALSEYENCSEFVKSYLKVEYKKLVSAKSHIETMIASGITDIGYKRADDDYSDFYENFESGNIRRWVDVFDDAQEVNGAFSGSIKAETEIVYDNVLQSNVLKMSGLGALTVKDAFLPEKMGMTKVSFKMKISAETNTDATMPTRIYGNYNDRNNYISTTVYDNTTSDERYRMRFNFIENGVAVNSKSNMNFDVELREWTNVTLTYTGSKVVITFDDGSDNVYTQSYNRSRQDAKFAIGAPFSTNQALMIDDVRIEMVKGDWDVDEKVTDTIVYYTGNTIQKPGDAVMIYGPNIYNTVKEGYVCKVPDVSVDQNNVAYIAEYQQDTSVTNGLYSTHTTAFWADSEARKIKFVQKTEDSLKFILPEDIGEGIYAVKLVNKSGQETVIYINNPSIDFCTGDQGEVTTGGGTFRIVGKALAVTENGTAKRNVSVVLRSENAVYAVSAKPSSDYSLVCTMPENVPHGRYEVLVYNGFGDNTCWSVPSAITVGSDPRDKWPDTEYNIRNFGATGDRQQNATPIFIQALSAISDNGGGVLYLPKGIYHLSHGIVIPEKVKIKGDGPENSIVVWSPDQWAIGELPDYMMAVTGNVEISDVAFYGQRVGNLYKVFDKHGEYGASGENLYLNNIRVALNPFAGAATDANSSAEGIGLGKYSNSQLYDMTRAELSNTNYIFGTENSYSQRPKNVQVKNLNIETEQFTASSYAIDSDYSTIDSLNVLGLGFGGAHASLKNGCILNSCFNGHCFSINGDGCYIENTTFENVTMNNRELAVADGKAFYGSEGDGRCQYVETDDDCTYRLVDKQYNNGYLPSVDAQIYVISGQGAGQTRRIVWNSGNEFKVDNPFTIRPNRNSKIIIRYCRNDLYYVNNTYHNGNAGGFFGGCADVVYDGNKHTRHGNFYFQPFYGDVNWYISIVNDTFEDAYVFHNNGWYDSDMERSQFAWLRFLTHNTGMNSNICTTVRRNSFDSTKLDFSIQSKNDMVCAIIDRNAFLNLDSAVNFLIAGNHIDGLLAYRNSAINCTALYNDLFVTAMSYRNSVKDHSVIVLDDISTNDLLGDVNGDGRISLADCTMIRYYIIGKLELNEQQKKRADIFGDGVIGLRNASRIRDYILGKVGTVAVKRNSDGEYIPGLW